MDERAVVVRVVGPGREEQEGEEEEEQEQEGEEITLTVVEEEEAWEVGIRPSHSSEIFYKAEVRGS